MDKQVQLAMAKWPNVPHCFGCLGLDARGAWRMRDQQAQQHAQLGDKITNASLRGFINRNYQADEAGRYFFQNGPQRVYVELQSTPYIAHYDPQQGWVLHTGTLLGECDFVWMIEGGLLVLQSGTVLAQIDDRDLFYAYTQIVYHGNVATEEQIMAWMEHPQAGLQFVVQTKRLNVELTQLTQLAKAFPFFSHPTASQID